MTMASTQLRPLERIVRTVAVIALTLLTFPGLQPRLNVAMAAPIADPAARVQIYLDHLFVQSDGDWHSSGELTLTATFARCHDPECTALPDTLAESQIAFSADSGTFPSLDRIFPKSGDTLADDVTEPFGIPLDKDATYRIGFFLRESDGFVPFPSYEPPDDSGDAEALLLNAQNNWRIGPHEHAATSGGQAKGRVNYEIRKVSLPDLRPVAINVFQNPSGGSQIVCTRVLNLGTEAPGAFQSTLYVDGSLGGQQFISTAGTLPVGEIGDLCVTVALPTTGRHMLAAVVDSPHGIIEQDETNNRFEYEYYAPAPAAPGGSAQSGSESGSGSPAALNVESVRVKGKEPSGQSDCDPGKNDVTVTLHNSGATPFASLVVRAIVDDEDNDATEKTLGVLDAGKSVDVMLEDVKLKKGPHTINVTAREKTAMNDQMSQAKKSVSVNCKDE